MALDFGNLVVENTDEIVAPATENPTVPWLRDSMANKVAKRVTVPATEARALVNLIVRGAEEAEVGATIRIKVGTESYVNKAEFWTQLNEAAAKYNAEHTAEGDSPLSVVVIFTAKARTLRPRTALVNSSTL